MESRRKKIMMKIYDSAYLLDFQKVWFGLEKRKHSKKTLIDSTFG